jgi:hypothetical protein
LVEDLFGVEIGTMPPRDGDAPVGGPRTGRAAA